ncbi:hypothetical protein XELAEV_18013454mg [Xenopus laevis]|uniref:Uncharacterized protein n=1 Tax=Xenopus laevis TaxID=8355 RepID=A0A974DPY8_XENLA|nr:hypothetical protein XELAEV_18013454mg [Xenopus laevis]
MYCKRYPGDCVQCKDLKYLLVQRSSPAMGDPLAYSISIIQKEVCKHCTFTELHVQILARKKDIKEHLLFHSET